MDAKFGANICIHGCPEVVVAVDCCNSASATAEASFGEPFFEPGVETVAVLHGYGIVVGCSRHGVERGVDGFKCGFFHAS